MSKISSDELNQFVNENIDDFHRNKLNSLKRLDLKRILKKKNPYLFKAKNLNSAHDLVRDILEAFLSSSEEKHFGSFLEELAIFISSKISGGRKSAATGIDLEFTDDGIHYLISVKSGPNWGNRSQHDTQEADFKNAVRVIKQSNHALNVQPVLGICYGSTKTTFPRNYMKVVGQNFWYLVSKDEKLYTDIIEPIGYRAKEHNEAFFKEKNRVINLLTQEFIEIYCDDGIINWERLVQFNSGNFKKAVAPS